jgi:hypothetical protein
MCYNQPTSFLLFGLGIVSIAYINIMKPKLPYQYITFILLFYTCMELLQAIQYSYVNQCDNKINKALTEVAYGFVIVQPLLWNVFFYLNSSGCDKSILMVGIVLSLIWMVVNLLGRIMYTPENRITKESSVFAGDKVCTRQNQSHLFWEWTSANFGEFNANFLMHLLIWFIPALITVQHRIAAILLIISICIGVWMAYISGEYYIFTSAWCYISVPIVIGLLLIETVRQLN